MDAWLWRWGGTSSLSRAQIRSFWRFGSWNSSNRDSSEKSTLLHSSMPQDFLSLQNFTRLACWTAVNWDWSWGLKGKTFKDWRICLRTVSWETLWPFEVNLAANLQVDWALLVKLLEMVIFAAFKSFGFFPRLGVLVSSCPVWCFFHHLLTVRMDTPIPLATSDWVLPPFKLSHSLAPCQISGLLHHSDIGVFGKSRHEQSCLWTMHNNTYKPVQEISR